MEKPQTPHPDTQLAALLGALASGTRLSILRTLRQPKALAEIEVRPPEEGGTGRALARQTVREHLDRLIQSGLVTTREVDRDYGATVEFLVNHQAVYAMSEELRGLARLRPAVEPEAMTVVAPREETPTARGPALVVVKGLDEGTTFDLRPRPTGPSEWVIGRRRGLAVTLDFDPYISTENARVAWDGTAHFIEDLPESRNGTTVNFRPIPKATRHPLRHGDIIGVGRSLLVYWA